ncbi:MAG: transglycosylase SLT domain-containing protein [Erythrobacter sp.]|nr:MAG: transglycosylase SLT domain-containing protein [Erythrobacter sp.]
MSDRIEGAGAASQPSPTQAAIAQAAERTGVDFSYLLAQARIESGLNPSAQARTSSASGLFQFIDQTWLSTLDRHGEALGYGEAASAIDSSGGRARVTDPAMRASIMALRFDPQAASMMAGALANDNRAALLPVLGREPDASELYLAHFLGAGGAREFLGALSSAPEQSAASILPAAARANRAIFYERSGAPRSVGEVMQVIRDRVERAMEAGPAGSVPFAPPPTSGTPASGPYRRTPFAPFNAPSLPRHAPAPLPSMAQTLQASFGLDRADPATPGLTHVRSAYARLEAFGL